MATSGSLVRELAGDITSARPGLQHEFKASLGYTVSLMQHELKAETPGVGSRFCLFLGRVARVWGRVVLRVLRFLPSFGLLVGISYRKVVPWWMQPSQACCVWGS